MRVKTLGLPHQTVGFQMVAARMRTIVSSDTMTRQEKLDSIKNVRMMLEQMARENGKFYAALCKE
jgi:hypothetical protein